ncbi:MAG: TonB-dependent hemoglobin/transferrin/lactoferrin family receptor [Cyanobacteria bacterium P01_H01_bin.21]
MNHTRLLRIILFNISFLMLFMTAPVMAVSDTVGTQEELKNLLLAQEDSSDEVAPSDEVVDSNNDGLLRITVTGTRTPRTVQSSPATVTVINAEDVNRLLIRDISDLVRYEPGVSVSNNLQFGLQDFNIRGIDGNRILIQVDDIRLPSAFQFGDRVTAGQGFNLGRDFFDTEILRTAEILRGPASTLYGSDALGGTVSYFTLDPTELIDQVGRNSAATGSTNFDSRNTGFTSTLVQVNRFDNIDTLLAYSRRDSSEAENLGDDQDGDRNSLLGKLVYNLSDTSAFDFTVEHFDNDVDTTTSDENLPLITGTTTRFEEEIDTTRTRLSLAYNYDNPESGSFLDFARARLYFQDSRTTEDNERELLAFDFRTFQTSPALRVSENRFVDQVFGGDVQLRSDFDWGNTAHRLTYGVDVSNTFNARPRDRSQTNLITGATTQLAIPDDFPTRDYPNSDTFRVGVYVQNEIAFGDQFSVIPGLRYDYYDLNISIDEDFERNGATATDFDDSSFSPTLALVYQPSSELSFYGRYARGFRAPQYDEINSGFTNQIFGYRTEPNPDLDAETSNSFEVGMRGNFSKFNFSLAGFYNRYNDFIDNQLVDTEFLDGRPLLVFQNVNIDDVETYGVEAKAEYQFTPDQGGFSLLGALSWTEGNNLTIDEPLSTVNPIEAVLGLRYRSPNQRWGAELVSTLVGEARGEGFEPEENQDPFVPDGFTVFDLIGYYQINPSLTFNLGLFNVFDTDYEQYSDVRFLDSNDALFDLQRARFEQPGLNVQAGVTWQF